MRFEVCILAGGLSTRIGRNKARLHIGRRTMLSIIRATARELGFPVRVIRRDLVPRCGPLGGVLTALKTTRAEAVLFLACDMPLVSMPLLRKFVRPKRGGSRVVFVSQRDRVGFPFLLPASARATVESQLAQGALSICKLAEALHARVVRIPARSQELLNVNTVNEFLMAKGLLSQPRQVAPEKAGRLACHSRRSPVWFTPCKTG